MRFVNRILMLLFCLMLLIGIFRLDFLYLGALIGFFLGVFQLLSSLTTLFYFDELDKHIKKCILIYLSLVTIYFAGYFLSINFLIEHGVIYIIPIILSLFWTYIVEYLKRE